MRRKLKTNANLSLRHKRRLVAERTMEDLLKVSASTADVEKVADVNSYPEISHGYSFDRRTSISKINILTDLETTKDLSSSSSDLSEPNGSGRADNIHCNESNSRSMRHNLVNWAIDFNIKQNAVTSLLQILHSHLDCDLPRDARTLLQTPRSVEVMQMGSGEFVYLGLQRIIENIIIEEPRNTLINLLINIDGLPISRSSNACLWPILCFHDLTKRVYLIESYYGNEKRKDSNKFLQQFVDKATLWLLMVFCLMV